MTSERMRIVEQGEGGPDDIGGAPLEDVQQLADRMMSQLAAAAAAAEREREQWQAERDGAFVELERTNAEIDRLSDELSATRADLDAASDLARTHGASVAEARARADELSAELEDERRTNATLRARLDGDAQSTTATFRKVKELTELRDTMLEELELARAELGLRASALSEAEVDADGMRQRLAEVERDNRRLQRELGELIDRVFEQEDALVDADSGELRREVQRLREHNERLQARTPTLEPDMESLAVTVGRDDGGAPALAEAHAEISDLQQQLRELWADMEASAQALDAAREEALEYEAIRREYAPLQRQRDELAGQVDEQRARIRELSQGASSESYEREMAVARELIDGLEQQCQRAESRSAGYKTELVEQRAINAELRKRLSAFGRRVTATRGPGRVRDLSDR
jgi:chromosome segregation ATPase